jgi:hypothetical protein
MGRGNPDPPCGCFAPGTEEYAYLVKDIPVTKSGGDFTALNYHYMTFACTPLFFLVYIILYIFFYMFIAVIYNSVMVMIAGIWDRKGGKMPFFDCIFFNSAL